MPSSDEEGGSRRLTEGEITCLPNFDALLVLRQGFSPSVGFADSSLQQSRKGGKPEGLPVGI